VREQVLTGLGWNILRVWSTDWWYDSAGCAERLHGALEALLTNSRAAAGEPVAAAHWDMGHEVEDVEEIRNDDGAATSEPAAAIPAIVQSELVSADVPSAPPAQAVAPAPASAPAFPVDDADDRYRITDLALFAADPERFHDFAYRETLRAMVAAVIEGEGPLRTDILCQRIARAHGWLRTGAKIRERIDLHLGAFDRTQESSGEFIWKSGTVAEVRPYRSPANDDSRRAIPDIPLAELASVIQVNPDLLKEHDPARELARLLGVERLAAGPRARLDEAIARGRGEVAPAIATMPEAP
jgi:hypothetical protein